MRFHVGGHHAAAQHSDVTPSANNTRDDAAKGVE